MPRLPPQNHQSASEVVRDAIFPRRSRLAAAFPGDGAGRRGHGKPGGAGPGGPVGLLRSPPAGTLCPAAPSRPAAGVCGGPPAGRLSPRVNPAAEGLHGRRRRRRRWGSWARSGEPALRVLARRWQTSHVRFENCRSHMAVGQRSGGTGVCGAVESGIF